MKVAWQPIYSIERSGISELTYFGAICVVAGAPDSVPVPTPIFSLGDTSFELWSRSLLKPWQLLSHLTLLKREYPALKPHHIAMMMASHSGEVVHQEVLAEIMQLGGLSEEDLRCPAVYPQEVHLRHKLQGEGAHTSRLYHNCSGKHLGYLLSLKARGGMLDHYLDPRLSNYEGLESLLVTLLHRKDRDLAVTTDGCQLPNYALSVHEMARLYQGLANPVSVKATGNAYCDEALSLYPEISALMMQFTNLIGGTDRVDTRLMSGAMPLHDKPLLIAKEGADGMLAVGVGPTERYPHGLGILIKVASGFDAKQMELIAGEVFAQLGMRQHDENKPPQPKGTRTDHLKTKFQFDLSRIANIYRALITVGSRSVRREALGFPADRLSLPLLGAEQSDMSDSSLRMTSTSSEADDILSRVHHAEQVKAKAKQRAGARQDRSGHGYGHGNGND